MKKFLALAAIGLSLITPLFAQAGEGFYIGAQGGGNFLDSHYLKERHFVFDTGYVAGAVGGYYLCPELRLEGEINYHRNDYRLHGLDDSGNKATFHGDIGTWSFMANGYFDIPICLFECVTPYIGVGIGYDTLHQKITVEGEHSKGNNTGFAWQLMSGLNLRVFEDVDLFVGYEFHKTPLRSGNKLQNQSVMLGIRKLFDFCY